MRSRTIASLFALCLLTSSAVALQDTAAFTIEYPLRSYRLGSEPPDKDGRALDLQVLLQRLASSRSVEVASGTDRLGGLSVVTGLSLARQVRPIRILWNDPRYLFRAPVVVEWIELVDERGRVTNVWVTASNQSPGNDRRIIEWCVNDALWQPVESDGRSSSVLRTAGVTLIGSPYHYTYWVAKARSGPGLVVAIALAALVLWLLAHVINFRRHQRLRHEEMMARLHRTSPYKAPSIDDED